MPFSSSSTFPPSSLLLSPSPPLPLSPSPSPTPCCVQPLFTEIRVLAPLRLRHAPGAPVASQRIPRELHVLRLWHQTDFERLVYVQPLSLFWGPAAELLDSEGLKGVPLAAAAAALPPDRFSARTLVLAPNRTLFQVRAPAATPSACLPLARDWMSLPLSMACALSCNWILFHMHAPAAAP